MFRAESGTRTRDLFITSETLYHLSYFGTEADVDSAISGAKIQRGMQNAKFKMQNSKCKIAIKRWYGIFARREDLYKKLYLNGKSGGFVVLFTKSFFIFATYY